MTAIPPSKQTSTKTHISATQEVLAVDMDRTLLATDMTLESVFGFIGKHPLRILQLLGWMLAGRAVLKARLAELAMPDVSLAPANPEVVAYIEQKKADGAYVVLASASNTAVVQRVADRFGFFDEVMGASEENNFKGSAKADGLNARFGKGKYAYMGDSPADLKVWPHAGKAVTVGAGAGLKAKAETIAPTAEHISVASREKKPFIKALIRAFRPHQWSKNVLVFIPLVAAQTINLTHFLFAILAFAVFSLTASSVYILNDMLDLDADRAHPRKKNRPFASGVLPIKVGIALFPITLGLAFLIAALALPPLFLLVLAGYFMSTLSYSLKLKQKVMVDVFLLAGLYTFRILAGGAATGTEMSPWLIGFSIFFFLALAIAKRLSELVDIMHNDKGRSTKRDYTEIDHGMLQSLGASAGFGAVIILLLYINSPEASALYGQPLALWGIPPLMLFWVSRIMVLANRGHVDDDPIVFAAKDRTSLLVGLCIVALVVLAELF